MGMKKTTTVVVEIEEGELVGVIARGLELPSDAWNGTLKGDHTLMTLTYSYEERE